MLKVVFVLLTDHISNVLFKKVVNVFSKFLNFSFYFEDIVETIDKIYKNYTKYGRFNILLLKNSKIKSI